jgi:hypothetical protein
VFDNDEVVAFIAEALPSELTAVMSFEDVQRIQRLHLDYLHAVGLARSGGDLQDADVARLLEEDEATSWIVDRAWAVRVRLEPAQVGAVIDAQLAYFEAIGAIDGLTPDEDDVRHAVDAPEGREVTSNGSSTSSIPSNGGSTDRSGDDVDPRPGPAQA